MPLGYNFLALIPKSRPEIKNRCRKQHIPQHASCLGCLHGAGSTLVRQWRQKRVLMRPEAAFPYVFAAEGAQHPPKKPPRSTPRHAHRPAKQAATLNAPPRSSPAKQAATLNAPPYSTRKPASTSLKRTIPFFTYLKLAGQTGQNGGLKKYFCGLNSRRRCI